MRVADDPDLAGWVSRAEALAFCARLGVRFERPDVETLRALLAAYLGRIPFHNIHMLTRYGRPPTREEILEDMRRGLGGPCNVMNPFLASLLARLEYDVTLVSGTMQQPDCHIALAVRIADRTYWVDAGNGHPYLDPVAFGDEAPRFFAGLAYRLVSLGSDRYALEHKPAGADSWTRNYTFPLAPRPLHFFAKMIEEHHTKPGFGPFLAAFRLIRFPEGAMTAIRDDVLLLGRASLEKTRLPDRPAFFGAIRAYFGDLDLPIEEALLTLERGGRPLFSVKVVG